MDECRKVKYATQKAAEQDIKRIQAKSTRNRVPVRAYFCKCGSWHITSQENKYIDEIKALKLEIAVLKDKIQALEKNENHQIKLALRRDEALIVAKKVVKKHQELIKKLRKSNSELLMKVIHNKQ